MTAQQNAGRASRILVALFFWRSLDLEGGAGLVAGVLAALERQGCEVSLLLPDQSKKIPARVPVTTYLSRSRLATAWRYLARLRRASKDADGVLVLENNIAFHLMMSPFLSRRTPTAVHLGSPVVSSRILTLGLRWQYVAHWLAKPRWLAWVLGRILGFPFSVYVVSTDHQRRQLLDSGCPDSKVEVAPFGVDPGVFHPGPATSPEAGRLVVGYLGHFSPIKGVPDLVSAFDLLVAERPEVELRMAWSGKGTDAGEVERLIARSPGRDRIRMLGRVDVRDFLCRLDVVVLPFRSGSIPHLPLVLLEAFACGIPVVTTRVGGLDEAIEDARTGFVVAPGAPEEIRRVLRRMCDEPSLRAAMRSHITATTSERFNVASFCRVILSRLASSERRPDSARRTA